ncbi:MAG: HAD hydrolase family protein [Thermodesulfovibrionales bacterium]|nr:HAD hydrolase family protein [Thermodesulfovibrionales bacterium]
MSDGPKRVIKALVLDIDGVLTDGTVEVQGLCRKRVFLRDIDALTIIRGKGISIAFMTGEDEAEAGLIVERCGGASHVIYGAKDKGAGIREMARKLDLDLSELCYLADARRDIPALKLVGLALCPADGDRLAKRAAHVVLEASGGRGAVSEAVDLILEQNEKKLDS